MTGNVQDYLKQMPEAIRNIISSLNLKTVVQSIGKAISLSSRQESYLQNTLVSFLDLVWFDKHARIALPEAEAFSETERKQINREIHHQILNVIYEKLADHDLDNETVLYEKRGIKLTANQLIKNGNSYETDRLLLKSLSIKRRGLIKKKDVHILHLEADYPEKGRWGDYVPLEIWFDGDEEVDLFINQLNKAIKVGNFNCFVSYFKQFEINDF